MTKKEHKDYRLAETLGHMLDKIEDLMEQDPRLDEAVKDLESLKETVAKSLIKGV